MPVSEQRISKLANKFISDFGPVTRKSITRINDDLQQGKINLTNVTPDEAIQVFKLVDAVSYVASPERYDNMGDIQDANAGKQLLQHQSLKSPYIQSQIAEFCGDGEYADAVNASQSAQQGTGMPDSNNQLAEQTGLQLDDPNEQPQQGIANSEASAYLSPTATAGGYQYVGKHSSFNKQETTQSSGKVVMHADQRGGTYTSSISNSNGDSRDQRAMQQQQQLNSQGKPVNTSAATGD